ncbi:MAG: Fe-S cluster assembly protein SufD [Verrucomicrobia bacterium]|mgnify:CR=1 FL=1|nr:Fe-S cluster assembly protein SufD [Verrucomicrobiota bacterium]MBT7066939.1 Fe-S cluster assembly protein SufD [Verrucomicrobiota bacterium]
MKRPRAITPDAHYADQLSAVLEAMAPCESAGQLAARQAAFDRFMEQGIPTRRVEAWKYTDVTRLAEEVFAPAAPAPLTAETVTGLPLYHPEDETVVFASGILQPGLSRHPEGSVLELHPLHTMPDPTAPVPIHDNPFVDLNHALWRDGALLRLPPSTTPAQRIHVLFVHATAATPTLSHPRLLIDLGEHATAEIAITHVTLGDKACFNNATLDITLQPGAHLELVYTQVLNQASTHLGTTTITQQRDSTLHAMDFSAGSALARHSLSVALAGEGASASLDGLYIVQGRQHVDAHTCIQHQQPNGSSRQLYKGILDDRATAAFSGLVRVHPGATGTDAQQMNRNLLLSNDALANSKPQLEISNDDVRCTHGATVGRLDDLELFYLASRGIDPTAARDMLSRGFAEEVLYRLPDTQRHADLHAILNRTFEKNDDTTT